MTDSSPRCNIGGQGRRKRMVLAIPLLAIGIVASFLDRSFWGQVIAFFGFLLYFQSTAGVCVALASRGARQLDGPRELLSDPEEIAYFRSRSRGIYIRTFLATLVLLLLGRTFLILSS